MVTKQDNNVYITFFLNTPFIYFGNLSFLSKFLKCIASCIDEKKSKIHKKTILHIILYYC